LTIGGKGFDWSSEVRGQEGYALGAMDNNGKATVV
jgi:hypothetical protein